MHLLYFILFRTNAIGMGMRATTLLREPSRRPFRSKKETYLKKRWRTRKGKRLNWPFRPPSVPTGWTDEEAQRHRSFKRGRTEGAAKSPKDISPGKYGGDVEFQMSPRNFKRKGELACCRCNTLDHRVKNQWHSHANKLKPKFPICHNKCGWHWITGHSKSDNPNDRRSTSAML